MKIRLDEYLVNKQMVQSIELARSFVMEGRVYLREEKLALPSTMVDEHEEAISLRKGNAYVSRGGLKLEKAMELYPIFLEGKLCMDVGSSTGGFTDCMLQNGAKRVFAIDVGYGLLDWKLRNDARVTVMERTNARRLNVDMLGGTVCDFASMDLSFISVKTVLPAVTQCLSPSGELVVLVKPQFEAAKADVGKGGIVRDEGVHKAVLSDVLRFLPSLGLGALGLCPSPIKGTDGNIEFLMYIRRGAESSVQVADIENNVYSDMGSY